jgi:hypothetical protein
MIRLRLTNVKKAMIKLIKKIGMQLKALYSKKSVITLSVEDSIKDY